MLSEAAQHTPAEEYKLSTYQQMRMAVPWVLANATHQEASLRATAPRLLGVIQDPVWKPRFARVMAPPCAASADLWASCTRVRWPHDPDPRGVLSE
jgi:hypothetical protein